MNTLRKMSHFSPQIALRFDSVATPAPPKERELTRHYVISAHCPLKTGVIPLLTWLFATSIKRTAPRWNGNARAIPSVCKYHANFRGKPMRIELVTRAASFADYAHERQIQARLDVCRVWRGNEILRNCARHSQLLVNAICVPQPRLRSYQMVYLRTFSILYREM